jgi:hypothetical protein
VAQRFVDDVTLELLAGRQHIPHTRGFGGEIDLLRRLLGCGVLR